MSNTEYDIIDELYFVTSFRDLLRTLGLAEEELSANLNVLIKQGYINTFYPDPDTEVQFNEQHFAENYQSYFFLATKAGLIAHNSL